MIGPIKPYNSITKVEIAAAIAAMDDGPLSGYLAGKERGGRMVCALEDAWQETFGVKHAIACNSNTSGMLAAAAALGVSSATTVCVPSLTMSATAAAPAFLGARLVFADVEPDMFCISKDYGCVPDVLMATNLFGQPASMGRLTDISGVMTIEDNAQAPFAMSYGRYAGTIADIGVFSLNVHKHFHCGEGGVCVTDDDHLAWRLRGLINHGEHTATGIGLNLRMPEVCAAIALAQLKRGRQLVLERVEQAEAIIDAIGDLPRLKLPKVRPGCTHVYYTIPFTIERNRAAFINDLRAQGIPIEAGYVDPLYRMPAFKRFARSCPVAEDLHDNRLFYIENCAYTFTKDQVRLIGEAFKRAAEKVI